MVQLLFCESTSLEHPVTLNKIKRLSLSILDTKEFKIFSLGNDLETWDEGVLVTNRILDASSQRMPCPKVADDHAAMVDGSAAHSCLIPPGPPDTGDVSGTCSSRHC